MDLFPYDAGTEEGTEFSLTNDATSPQGTIASIKGTGKFSNEPIATLVFDLLAAPVITTTSPILVPENETAVATLTASDDDTPIADLTWTIPSGADGGADADHFTLSEGGILAFSAAKDYEAPDDADADRTYEVTVQVSDGTETDSADLVVTLENVVELTAITEPASVEFPENSWSRVAAFTASSEEDRAGIDWVLAGTDSDDFSIDSPPGALRFALDAVAPRIFSEPPDFEAPVDGDAANTAQNQSSRHGPPSGGPDFQRPSNRAPATRVGVSKSLLGRCLCGFEASRTRRASTTSARRDRARPGVVSCSRFSSGATRNGEMRRQIGW